MSQMKVTPHEVGSNDPDPNKLSTIAKVAIVAALVLGSLMVALAAFVIHQILDALANAHF